MALSAWIVIWCIFGFLCCITASLKGHNVFLWFLIGFMFGPFAFLAILIKNKEPSKKEKDSLKDGSMIKCPFCAETIKPEAKVCKHCDRDLPPNKNNIVEIHKTEYTSAIIDGDLKKLKELISTGGSIDSFKDDLIITADVYDRHEIVNYLKSIN